MIGNLVEKLLNGSKTFVFDPFWSPKIGSSKNQQVFMPKSTIFPGIIRDRVLNHLRSSDRHKKKKKHLYYIRLSCIYFYTKTRWSSFAFHGESLKLNSPTPKNLIFKTNLEQKMSSTCLFTCFCPAQADSVFVVLVPLGWHLFLGVWRKWIRKNLWDKTNKHWEFASDYP